MGAYSTHTQLSVELHSCLQLHPKRDPSQRLCSSAEPSQWPCLACRLTWQLYLIWVPRQLALIFLGLGREADAQPRPTAEHCLHPDPTRNPGQRTQAAMEPIQQPCLGRKPSQ